MLRAYEEFPANHTCICDEEQYYILVSDSCRRKLLMINSTQYNILYIIACDALCKWCPTGVCTTCKTTGNIKPLSGGGLCKCVDGYYHDSSTNTCLSNDL